MDPPSARRTALLSWALALAVRLLAATWRVRFPDRAVLDAALAEGPVILAFLHGQQLPLIPPHRSIPMVGMVSKSADGDLLAQVLHRLGISTIRGSSSRGGVEVARAACRAVRRDARSVAIAVDGPRGPRLVAQPGAATLAALVERPIVLVTARARPCLRLSSWDRFEIPPPFAEVQIRYQRLETPDRHPDALQACTEAVARGLREGPVSSGPGP